MLLCAFLVHSLYARGPPTSLQIEIENKTNYSLLSRYEIACFAINRPINRRADTKPAVDCNDFDQQNKQFFLSNTSDLKSNKYWCLAFFVSDLDSINGYFTFKSTWNIRFKSKMNGSVTM